MTPPSTPTSRPLYKAVGLDPGGTTGWAIWRRLQPHSTRPAFECGQIGPTEHHMRLYRFLTQEDPDVVIYEGFWYRPHLPNAELISNEYIGVIRLWAKEHQKFCIKQPVFKNGNSFVKDQLLERMALWSPGRPHAMDAYRQLINYLVTRQGMTGLIPPKENRGA
jgi:hypothetical protein